MCALRSALCALRSALCLMCSVCSVVSVQVFRPEAILFEHRHADGTWSFPVRAGENFNSVNQTLHDAGYVTLQLPAACGGGGGVCSQPPRRSQYSQVSACLPTCCGCCSWWCWHCSRDAGADASVARRSYTTVRLDLMDTLAVLDPSSLAGIV